MNIFMYAIRIVRSFFIVVFNYFAWILSYSKNVEKIPLTKRYDKVRNLVKKLIKIWHIDIEVINNRFLIKNDKPYLGVSNHRSFCDPAFYIYLSERPISFIAKKELMKKFIIGRIIRIIDGVFVERDDLRSQFFLFNEVAEKIKNTGLSYFIFPEGTRIKDLELKLLPYKNGSIKIAYWAGVNIIPNVLYGTELALKRKSVKRKVIIEIMRPMTYNSFKEKSTTEITNVIYQNTSDKLDQIIKKA